MRTILSGVLMALLASGVMAAEPHPHWGYQGEHDPAHWAELDPGFETCALGHSQSPIDIRHAHRAELPAIAFDYHASPAETVNNGHTIQVNLADAGGIRIADAHYSLVQFHFHTPSEEKIDGKSYPMEAHFVHKNADGHLAVVAVMLKQGRKNAALAEIFETLPAAEGGSHALHALNPALLLPAKHGYYSYSGSLTTPPCSEGVRWQVLKQPIEVSKSQIQSFRKLYPMNARPVQPLNGRQIEESRS